MTVRAVIAQRRHRAGINLQVHGVGPLVINYVSP